MSTKSTANSATKTQEGAKGPSDPRQAPINARLTPAEKIELYRTMVRIRRFEERSLRSYQAKKIGGFLHLYIGQEAVAVGCCSLMGANDHVITAYRDHGHAIAVGMDTKPLMAELYGKVTGCSKGKGGSMHYFDPSRNFWGGHGIVGGQIPLGTGLAFELPMASWLLSNMGILTPDFLREYRKYAYVALLVIAAVITPSPDWGSQLVVVVPLVMLYEVSIMISARVTRKQERKMKEWG